MSEAENIPQYTVPGGHYSEHLEVLGEHLQKSLEEAERGGAAFEGVVFHTGQLEYYHADDHPVPFHASAHFRRYTPLPGPDHVVLARPGHKPRVVRVLPQDYWYDTTPPPVSYWESSVDLVEVTSFDDVVAHLGAVDRLAYVGPDGGAAGALGFAPEAVEPAALLAPLDWYRAYKTRHELDCLRRAAEHAAAGHRRAREVFELGASERQIHWAFLEASDQLEHEVPYETIVALNEKSAILHYQNKRGSEAAPGSVFLLDAGAAWHGYAADITRTWTREDTHEVFRALVRGVDILERELVAMVTSGRPYLDIHLDTHRLIAALLADLGIVSCGADEAYDRGVTRTFMPHGVGHQLGLQVHDVGGHQAGPSGGRVPPPEEHPFLRNTRLVEPGHVLTIEPGIYFIPVLLEPLRATAEGALVNWDLVEELLPFGGVRIEDNVVCTEEGPWDFTRDLIPGP